MEKYITSIKDLVALKMTNAIEESDESVSNFQKGMIHLLGVNTQVNFVRAKQFFGNSSLKNDLDANYLIGFIDECEGNYSSSFKQYALAAEIAGEKRDSAYFQKVSKGREMLQKTFKKYNLPLTLNNQITKILNEINKGTAKKKLNSKMIAAFLCEDDLSSIEVAQELFDGGDYYSAKSLLQKGNVNSSCSLYVKIDKTILASIENIDTVKGTVLELESESILPDYNNSLSLDTIKKECENSSISCCREWREATKIIIDKMVKSQKRKNAKEKEKKKKNIGMVILFAAIPLILLIALWILFGDFILAGAIVFFYYCLCVYAAIKM
jgi:hypothetical protein